MTKAIIHFLFYLFLASPSFAQTASILPLGITQFFDNNGNPLSSGKVYNYIPNTLTFKNTWQESTEVTLNTNPVTLDAAGRALIYGQGTYRQIVRKSDGTLVWDAVTSSTGAGGGTTATGDGDLVGTIKPWAGIIAPNQYAFANGQEISRSTFSVLFTAITQTISNVICSSGSPILSGFSDTTSINHGAAVEISCMAPGTVVVSKTGSTVTVSNNALISTTVTGVFFPFGNGNASTTFNLPDLRDFVIAGRANMGGIDRGLITSAFFGFNPTGQGAIGGLQTTTGTLVQANLPAVTLTTTIASGQGSHVHDVKFSVFNQFNVTAANNAVTTITSAGSSTGTGAAVAATLPAMTGTTPLGGTATNPSLSTIQPTMMMNYIIKTTPDTNSAIASGVTSLGGMTGDIACGTGLTCTGNIVSVGGAIGVAGANTQIQFNSSGIFGASANLTWVSPALTIGAVGSTTGQLNLTGSGSGTITIQSQAATGTYNFNLPIAAGSLNQLLTSGGGGATAQSYQNIASLLTSGTGITITGTTNATVSLSTINADFLLANATAGVAIPTGVSIGSCSAASSALTYNISTHAFGCNTISGSGTVNSGTAGQLAYYATSTTVVSSNANANISNGALSLGVNTSVAGSLKLFGGTSGDNTIKVPAVAGTSTIFQLPPDNGTNGFVLQTDGTGVTSWVVVAGTGTVTSATIAAGAGMGTFTGTCTITTVGTCTIVGSAKQLPGTTTNDSASAGNMGEIISSPIASPGVSLTTATTANLTSVSLTAGDWDVFCNPIFLGAASTNATYLASSISLVSTTFAVVGGQYSSVTFPGGQLIYNAGLTNIGFLVGPYRASLSGTTTVYCVAQSAFTVSTTSVFGLLFARRVR